MTRKLRVTCAGIACLTTLVSTRAQAVICVPSYDHGVVWQTEYPYTSCRWNNQSPGAWDPPGPTQMQILTYQNDCLMLECTNDGDNGRIGKLTAYYAPGAGASWDNRVWRSKLGWNVEGRLYKDQCGQGTTYPAWGVSEQTWDNNQGLTTSISSVQCWLYR